jgi:hypothetical protein
VSKELENLHSRLERLQSSTSGDSDMEIRSTMDRMNELLYREEMMWLQRSRIAWLKEGDRNTKYFQQKAQWRSRKNNIKKLRKEDGQWCENWNAMCVVTCDFFRHYRKRALRQQR